MGQGQDWGRQTTCIPDFERLVVGARDDRRAVGREGHGVHKVVVVVEDVQSAHRHARVEGEDAAVGAGAENDCGRVPESMGAQRGRASGARVSKEKARVVCLGL